MQSYTLRRSLCSTKHEFQIAPAANTKTLARGEHTIEMSGTVYIREGDVRHIRNGDENRFEMYKKAKGQSFPVEAGDRVGVFQGIVELTTDGPLSAG